MAKIRRIISVLGRLVGCLFTAAMLCLLGPSGPVAQTADPVIATQGLPVGALDGRKVSARERAELELLLRDFRLITRKVTRQANGYRSVTTSSDKDVKEALVGHVTAMLARLEAGDDPRIAIQSPTLGTLFVRHHEIATQVQVADDGIIVVQTSTNPAIANVLKRHAWEVSYMSRRGIAAVHDMRAQMLGQ